MCSSTQTRRYWLLTGLAVLLAAATLILPVGCGPKEEEAPPEAAAPQPKVEPKVAEPVTLEVLRLTPEGTTVAVAIPPLSGLYEKGVALAKRLAPDEASVDAALAEWTATLAAQADAPNATNPLDVLRAKGINPDAPAGVFLDLSGVDLAGLGRALGEMSAFRPPMAPLPLPEELESLSPEEQPEPEAALSPETPLEEEPDMDAAMSEALEFALQARLAVVVPYTDADVVTESLDAAVGGLDPALLEQRRAGDVTINVYRTEIPLAYFFTEKYLIASNSPEMIERIVPRLTDPAPVRYGSPGCPAGELDELVQLTRMDHLMPLLKVLMEAMGEANPMMGMAMKAQSAQIEEAVTIFANPDPLVTTLAWTQDRIELLSRLNLESHPRALEKSGEPAPLQQAIVLPESTQAFMAFRMPAEAREQLKTQWLNSIPPEIQQDPALQQSIGMVNVVTSLLGEEFTVSVHGQREGLPLLSVMVGLGDVQGTRNLLQAILGLSMAPSEVYKGLDIMTAEGLPLPAGGALHYAFPQNMLMVTNDLAAMKTMIDRFQEGSVSGLFASFKPAFDPGTPRYAALVVRNALLDEVILPLLSAHQPLERETAADLERITEVFREVRLSSEVDRPWLKSQLAIYLNPPVRSASESGSAPRALPEGT